MERSDCVTCSDSGSGAPTSLMLILQRYIALNVVRGFLLLGLILVSLFAIILLIDELDDVGTGSYTWRLAISYVLLHTPKLLLDFAAFISLVGSIVALGAMAGQQELVAIESVGGTPKNVTQAVIATAVFLMLGVLAVAQFLIPPSLHTATTTKTIATQEYGDFVSNTGYWSQNDGRFLHVRDIRFGRVPTNVEIFEFNEKYELDRVLFAKRADIEQDGRWTLQGVQIKELIDGKLHMRFTETLMWDSFLNSSQLGIIVSKPEALSLTNLYHFVQGLKQRGEQSYRYELIFWQKLMNPIAAAIMILLGMRFVFGSQRHVSMGKRITFGVLAGIAFYVLSQLVTHVGTLSKLSPLLIAITPAAVVLTILLVMYKYSGSKS